MKRIEALRTEPLEGTSELVRWDVIEVQRIEELSDADLEAVVGGKEQGRGAGTRGTPRPRGG